MRLYWELSKLAFQRQITYRAATLAGLATNLFFGMLRVAVLVALYGSRTQVEGISMADAITYTGVSQGTIAYLSLFSWYEVMNSVYTGAVATDLLKPMSYFSFWMAQDFGRAVASLLLRGAPILVAYAFIFDISHPHDVSGWAAFGLALVLAWFVSFSWRFLVNLAALWTPNALGVGRLAFIVSWFLSGFMMPLRFFPDWFIDLCYLTPFPHMVNTIIEVYLGLLTGPQLVAAFSAQAVWVVILVVAARIVLGAGVRRLVILGG